MKGGISVTELVEHAKPYLIGRDSLHLGLLMVECSTQRT